MTRKTKPRCASCYAKKGRIHDLYCQRENRDLFPGGPVYNLITTDTGSFSSGGCDTSSSDGGSSCGSAC